MAQDQRGLLWLFCQLTAAAGNETYLVPFIKLLANAGQHCMKPPGIQRCLTIGRSGRIARPRTAMCVLGILPLGLNAVLQEMMQDLRLLDDLAGACCCLYAHAGMGMLKRRL
jgi:hypothetical protein